MVHFLSLCTGFPHFLFKITEEIGILLGSLGLPGSGDKAC